MLQVILFLLVLVHIAMRISDSLAANWNHLWVASVLLFKFMDFIKFWSIQGKHPSITLLVYSVTLPSILVFAAFLVDLVIAIRVRSVLHCEPGSVRSKTCKGGICWHDFGSCKIVCDENFELGLSF